MYSGVYLPGGSLSDTLMVPERFGSAGVGPGVPLSHAQRARIEPLFPVRTPKWRSRWRDAMR